MHCFPCFSVSFSPFLFVINYPSFARWPFLISDTFFFSFFLWEENYDTKSVYCFFILIIIILYFFVFSVFTSYIIVNISIVKQHDKWVLMECFLMPHRKTALMLALCKFLRDKYSLAAVSIVLEVFTTFQLFEDFLFDVPNTINWQKALRWLSIVEIKQSWTFLHFLTISILVMWNLFGNNIWTLNSGC